MWSRLGQSPQSHPCHRGQHLSMHLGLTRGILSLLDFSSVKIPSVFWWFPPLLDEEHTEPPKELERASDRIIWLYSKSSACCISLPFHRFAFGAHTVTAGFRFRLLTYNQRKTASPARFFPSLLSEYLECCWTSCVLPSVGNLSESVIKYTSLIMNECFLLPPPSFNLRV